MFSSKVLLAPVLALILMPMATAQVAPGSVSGFVLDGQTGRPITGASIAVNGNSTQATVTDADGRFTIPLSPGTYRLQITAANYAPVDLSEVVVKTGEATEASTVMSNKSLVTKVDVT